MPPILLQLIFNKYTAAIVLALSLFGYIWFLRSSIHTLEAEKTQLLITVEEQKQAVEQLKKDVAAVSKAKDDFIKATDELNKQKKDLEETLYRENQKKKSLEQLALKKTTLIQKKVNDATQKVFKCFETLSDGGDC